MANAFDALMNSVGGVSVPDGTTTGSSLGVTSIPITDDGGGSNAAPTTKLPGTPSPGNTEEGRDKSLAEQMAEKGMISEETGEVDKNENNDSVIKDSDLGEDRFGGVIKPLTKDEDQQNLTNPASTKPKDQQAQQTPLKDQSQQPQKPPQQPVPQARDYSGYDEAEVKMLRGMPNGTFNYFAPILKEYKNTKTTLEGLRTELENAKKSPSADSYYDPIGYVNRPEYQEAYQKAEQYDEYAGFWRQALLDLDTKNECTVIQVDAKGEPFTTQMKVTTEAEKAALRLQISDAREGCIRGASENRGTLNSIRTNWEQRSNANKNVFNIYEKQLFGKYSTKEHKDNPAFNAMLKTFDELGQMHNPSKRLFAALWAEYVMVTDSLKALENKVGKNGEKVTPPNGVGAGTQLTETIKKTATNPSSELPSSVLSGASGGATRNKTTFISDTDMPGRFGNV